MASASWLELSASSGAGCPVRMTADSPPGACHACGRPVEEGQLFLVSGYCAMGGVVDAASAYADMLEERLTHVGCAPSREPECWTIGHGTREIDAFLDLLTRHEIRVLADIRTVPGSRHNPQYGRDELPAAVRDAGLCYLHLPALGGLRKPRPDSPNAGWRNDSFRGYADYMQTPEFESGLAELLDVCRWRRTAIMCAETVYWRCHRSLVADALFVRGIPAWHILSEARTEPHRLTRFASAEGTRLLYPPEP